MERKPKRGEWILPNKELKLKQKQWAFLDDTSWTHEKVDTTEPVTYFNNPLKRQMFSTEYDQYFAYTKSFPLWDQRKAKDNIQYPPDVWRNIYEQERKKCVPVTTSANYGLTCRLLIDQPENDFKVPGAMKSFMRRNGVMPVKEKKPQ